LHVKKVPLADRAAGCDRQQGFRYYLNRPYLVVKAPITITEMRSLVLVHPDLVTSGGVAASGAGKAPGVGEARLSFVSGPRQGQTVRLADLKVETPGSGTFRPVSPPELKRISDALTGEVTPVVARDTPPDAEVSLDERGGLGAFATGPAAAGAKDTASSDLQQAGTATVKHAPALTGNIDVVYLPDLDEQYVIKSCNVLGKTSFGLTFRNGGELADVQAEHDATALPLSILQQIQAAIAAAQGVEQERIKREAKALQSSKGAAPGAKMNIPAMAAAGQQMIWQMIERTSIKPGVYRLNKPWEIEGGQPPAGYGLLAKLGLPTVVDVDFLPVAVAQKGR
jgi:hypothetical protein